jgi:NAD(P)-dependent dehydrogenase (short-subunit alcohol dehydrogenase family)
MTRPAVMIVTGGSRGIGAATARLAATRGYAVCVNYQDRHDAAEQVVQEITNNRGRAVAIQADIGSESGVLSLFEEVDRRMGTLCALVNNAATLERQMRLDAMEASRLERIFAVNVLGSMLCAREAVKRMSARHNGQGGAIVNVSSGAARYGSAGEYVDYAASKGAIETFTIGLAREVAMENIRVNAVRPGHIYTDLHAKGGEPQRVDRVKAQIPMQRGGKPEEVASAILWLLSEEASYVTGTILDVAGGR